MQTNTASKSCARNYPTISAKDGMSIRLRSLTLTSYYSLTRPGSPRKETTLGATAEDNRRMDVPMEGAEPAQTTDIVAAGEGQGGVSSKTLFAWPKLRTIFRTGSLTTTCYWTAIRQYRFFETKICSPTSTKWTSRCTWRRMGVGTRCLTMSETSGITRSRSQTFCR